MKAQKGRRQITRPGPLVAVQQLLDNLKRHRVNASIAILHCVKFMLVVLSKHIHF